MQKLQELTILPSTSIQQSLKLFGTQDGLRMLIVNDEFGCFLGILTDQDVRRGILQGLTIKDQISSIYNPSPITAHINSSAEELIELSAKHNIHEIPLLDDEGKVVKIQSILKLISKPRYPNKVVIMAGGLGTRLKPLTDTIPKPMLKVGHKPILQIILERFKMQGFSNIILCVNYKSHIIEEYFGNGKKFGLHISYIKEEKRMGTAGALGLIENIGNNPFFVMNGDILTDIDFAKMLFSHSQNNSNATMGIREYEYQIPYGVVQTNKDQIIKIEEKPIQKFHVSAGIYILNPSILPLIPKEEFFDMPSLFDILLQNKSYKASTFLIEDYWIDIGRHEEYDRAIQEIGQY